MYLKDAKTCTNCSKTNAKSCDTSDAITACKDADATNFYYRVSDSICIEKAVGLLCKTIAKKAAATAGSTTAGDYLCASCFDGYQIDNGVCRLKTLYGAGATTSGGATETAADVTCSDTYYKEWTAATITSDGFVKCKPCDAASGSGFTVASACKKCTSDGRTSGTHTWPKCTEAKTGYGIKSDYDTISCGTGCDVCTVTTVVTKCTTLTPATANNYYVAYSGTAATYVQNNCETITGASTQEASAVAVTKISGCK